MSNIRIESDGEIAAVSFDFVYSRDRQPTNRGLEAWHLLRTSTGWRIVSVVWSNHPPAIDLSHSPVKDSIMQTTNLTPRQSEVLGLLLEGRANKEIARTLNISPFTARAHVAAVMKHYGATRRQHLPALCDDLSGDRFAQASDMHDLSIPRLSLSQRWLAGALPSAAFAGVIAFAGSHNFGPTTSWKAAGFAPEAVILKSDVGRAHSEIRIDTIETQRIGSPNAFLGFSKAYLTTAMAQQHLGLHRFEPVRIDNVNCLAYSGVSSPSRTGSAITYTHAKGYLCQHPRRPNAAIRIDAFAEGRTKDFADGDAMRIVLRDLLEKAVAS